MNSFKCENYCSDPKLKSVLDKVGLLTGGHAESSDMYSSLVSSITATGLIQREALENFLLSIYDQREFLATYNIASRHELGPHKGILGNGAFESPFGLLCVISKRFNVDIYVVCGMLSFKAIHLGRNLLKFKQSDQNHGGSIFLGCVGLRTFHSLVLTDSCEATALRLNPLAISIDSHFIRETTQISRNFIEDNYDSDDIESDAEPENSMPLTEYCQYFDKETRELDPSVYREARPISYKAYSDSIKARNPVSILRTLIDIDAIFGILSWDEISSFKGNVNMLKSPIIDTGRNLKNFISFARLNDPKLSFIKIGTSGSNNDILFDVFLAFQLDSRLDGDNLINAIAQSSVAAHSKSIAERCYDPILRVLKHPGCKNANYQTTIDNHSSPLNTTKPIIFTNERFNCFCFFFRQYFLENLRNRQVEAHSAKIYLQAVGTKSKLAENDVNGLFQRIKEIDSYIDVEKATMFYDIAFSTSLELNERNEKVCFII